jgi:hypothetical protein
MKEQTATVLREPQPTQAPVAPAPDVEEAPPFLGTWRNVYLFVLGELALTVVAFYALTRWVS